METLGDGEATGGSGKRKRGGGGGVRPVEGPANAAADAGALPTSLARHSCVDEEELLHPNLEELARQYPSFEAVYRRHQHLLSGPSAEGGVDGDTAKQQCDQHHHGANKGSKLQQAMAAPDFRLELTRALLRHHWNVRLPSFDSDTHLCPPVPNRYYFVRWLREEVLRTAAIDDSPRRFHPNPSRANEIGPNESCPAQLPPLRGLDIGTGAAAIYALLWAATSTTSASDRAVEIYGTDVDERAVEHARRNVLANQNLMWSERRSRVHVLAVPLSDRQRDPSLQPPQPTKESAMEVEVPTTRSVLSDSQNTTSVSPTAVPRGPLRVSLDALAELHRAQSLQGIGEAGGGDVPPFPPPPVRLDFCLTNPPFFDIHEDRGGRADGQDRAVMTHDEGCYPGGEYAFLVDMIADGLYLHHQSRKQAMDEASSPLASGPPRWMACMCGKKSTFTKIRGVLRYVLGRSRVMSTEFGPGFMTRWFVAWTMSERPTIRSPLATWTTFSFRIPLPLPSDRHPPTNPLDEVEDRVREYCESFPGVDFEVRASRTHVSDSDATRLRMTLRPQRAELCADQDDTLPEPIRSVVSMMPMEQRLEWLPPEGHFLLELIALPTNASSNSPSSPGLLVSVESFAHNQLGRAVVERVQVQLEGEINRTSRRWRRILQRRQQQQQEQQQQPRVAPEAMDET